MATRFFSHVDALEPRRLLSGTVGSEPPGAFDHLLPAVWADRQGLEFTITDGGISVTRHGEPVTVGTKAGVPMFIESETPAGLTAVFEERTGLTLGYVIQPDTDAQARPGAFVPNAVPASTSADRNGALVSVSISSNVFADDADSIIASVL